LSILAWLARLNETTQVMASDGWPTGGVLRRQHWPDRM